MSDEYVSCGICGFGNCEGECAEHPTFNLGQHCNRCGCPCKVVPQMTNEEVARARAVIFEEPSSPESESEMASAKSIIEHPASPLDEEHVPCVVCAGDCADSAKYGELYRCKLADEMVDKINRGEEAICVVCGARITKATFRHCDGRRDALLGRPCPIVGYMANNAGLMINNLGI